MYGNQSELLPLSTIPNMKIKSLLTTLIIGTSLFGGSLFANSVILSPLGTGEIWADTSDNGDFKTFCLEKGTFFYSGVDYTYDITTAAYYGGADNSNAAEKLLNKDTISVGTAWLYLNFLDNTLPGVYDGSALQKAIWALEDEIAWDANNDYLKLFGSQAAAKMDYTGVEVAVLNPWLGDSRQPDVQSVLVRFPVPDGGTSAVLLGLGLISMTLIRRKK